MLKSISNRGFHLTFENGWTVSVQFGPGHYCEHHGSLGDYQSMLAPMRTGDHTWQSKDAEVAAWDADNNWFNFGDDTVRGYLSANEVADFIAQVAAF